MRTLRGFVGLVLCLAAMAAAGCSGGRSSAVPSPGRIGATPTPLGSSSPAATPVPGSTPNVAAATAAIASAGTFYEAQTGSTTQAALAATAANMVSSGNFASAVVASGGIIATLPSGFTVVLFADRPEEQGDAPLPAAAARHIASAPRQPRDLSPANAHEFAFLVNTTDTTGAFVPARQAILAEAWSAAGSNDSFGTDELPVTLENIIALGKSHPLDLLTLSTHGMVGGIGPTHATAVYFALADTPVTQDSVRTYASDIAAQTIFIADAIHKLPGVPYTPKARFAFTQQWMLPKLAFNPGALFDNASCHGQDPDIASIMAAATAAAGIGTYIGWNGSVDGTHADQTDGFINDRLTGEQDPQLAQIVGQRSPLQRPFALPAVLGALSENRSGGLLTENASYAYSPPIPPATTPTTLIVTANSQTSDDALVVPSIEALATVEGSPGSMYLEGTFPAAQGTVQITPPGADAIVLPVVSWSPTEIQASLPSSVAGGGDVKVLSAFLESPLVELTYWQGSLAVHNTDALTFFGDVTGSGSGQLNVASTFGIRGDVHAVVPTIDAAPQSYALNFNFVTPASTATLSNWSGSFSGSGASAMFTSSGPVAMTPFGQTNVFQIAPGSDGSGADCTGYVLCPTLTFAASGAGTCTAGGAGDICAVEASQNGPNGSPTDQIALRFTMDPSTYALTFSPETLSVLTNGQGGYGTPSSDFGGMATQQEAVTGSFAGPVDPPNTPEPAGPPFNTASLKALAAHGYRRAH